MAYGKEISGYKNKIAAALLENEKIVKAISEVIPKEKADEIDDLMYHYIFPYDYIPQIPQEVGCYICYELYVPKVSTKNYFFKDLIFEFVVICHQDVMRTDYGATRIDYIASLIEEIFNGSDDYTFKPLELVSSVPGHVTQKHRCRTVRFVAEDFNKEVC